MLKKFSIVFKTINKIPKSPPREYKSELLLIFSEQVKDVLVILVYLIYCIYSN